MQAPSPKPQTSFFCPDVTLIAANWNRRPHLQQLSPSVESALVPPSVFLRKLRSPSHRVQKQQPTTIDNVPHRRPPIRRRRRRKAVRDQRHPKLLLRRLEARPRQEVRRRARLAPRQLECREGLRFRLGSVEGGC